MKNKTTAGILALFVGWFGVHRFYLGQRGLGIAYLLFCWIPVVWLIALIDGIVLLTMDDDKFDRKYNPHMLEDQRRVVFTERVTEPPEQVGPPPADPFRRAGDEKYAAYDFEGAMREYRRSLNVDPRQPQVHFKLACLHSIHENKGPALFHLRQAIDNGYYDFETIESHDHLAYLRSTPEYETYRRGSWSLSSVGEVENVAPATAPEPAPEETLELSNEMITRIERLAKLREDGILSPEDFEREKVKILRGYE